MPDAFFRPIVIIMDFPALAFIPAVIFGGLYLRHRRSLPPAPRKGRLPTRLLALAALLWLLYGFYETYMYYWSKTVIAPLRVDLLLITPLLYAVTIAGAAAALVLSRQHRAV